MPPVLRATICLAVLILGLLAGRYLIPSARSAASDDAPERAEAAGRQQFWGEVAAAAIADPVPGKKAESFLTFLDKVEAADFPAVAETVKADALAAPLLAARWAEVDPPGFFKFLASRGVKTAVDHQFAAQLLYSWAGRDLASATAAASRLRVPGAVPDSLTAISYSLLQSDARKGLEFLYQNKPELASADLLPLLHVDEEKSPLWKGLDLPGRIGFFQNQPAGELREAALAKLFAVWSSQDPKAVLLAAQESGRGTDLIPRALQIWMEKDANAVSQFFQTEAKDTVKAAAGLALARRVAAADPQAAWDFAQWFLSGAPRAAALRFTIGAIAKGDPHEAALRLAEIPDAPWRRQSMADLALTWHAKDAEAALFWIESELSGNDQKIAATALATSATLPENKRAELRERFHLPEP